MRFVISLETGYEAYLSSKLDYIEWSRKHGTAHAPPRHAIASWFKNTQLTSSSSSGI